MAPSRCLQDGWVGCGCEDLGVVDGSTMLVGYTAPASCPNLDNGWNSRRATDYACSSCAGNFDEMAQFASDTLLTGKLKIYHFTVLSPFSFSASSCDNFTDYDTNMALYTHDGVMMLQNDDANAACGSCTGVPQANHASELFCHDAQLPPGE